MLTSRSQHLAPAVGTGAGSGLYDTFEAGAAFYANRIDWVYSMNASFVREALEDRNYTAMSLAMNSNLPDPANATHAPQLGSTYTIGRAENVHGEPITAPWMRTWTPPPYYGCINKPEYRALALNWAASLVAAGSTAVQHDDPTSNLEQTTWDGGDPNSSGCYCDDCMSGFTQYLLAVLNDTERAALNVSQDFNYRQFLLGNSSAWSQHAAFDEQHRRRTSAIAHHDHDHDHDHDHQHHQHHHVLDANIALHRTRVDIIRGNVDLTRSDDTAHALRLLFVEFQRNSTVQYIDDVRAHIAAAEGPYSPAGQQVGTRAFATLLLLLLVVVVAAVDRSILASLTPFLFALSFLLLLSKTSCDAAGAPLVQQRRWVGRGGVPAMRLRPR